MEKDIFFRFGGLIYHLRWVVIALTLVLLLVSIPFLPHIMEPFKAIGFVDPNSQSAKAEKLLNDKIGYSYNRLIVLYQSNKLRADDPAFQNEIKKSLANLKKIKIKHEILYPDSNNKRQISKDKRTAYAIVIFKSDQEVDPEVLRQFKSAVRTPPSLKMSVGGEPVFLEDTKNQTQIDLYKSEYIATPVAIITMLLVFGTVVAASLPILLGGMCALFIFMALFCLGQFFSLSVFTLNIALLLGLCLSLDYALFIISRFREELEDKRNVIDAIAVTQATAGKAIFFSGLAVFVSLSALLLFPINILFSVGMGGLAAVFVSVFMATVVLPAVLSILQYRVNSLKIPFLNHRRLKDGHFWRGVVTKVIQHRYLSFFSILILLLFLGYPFLKVQFGISDFRILPKTMQSRQVFDTFKNKFGETELAPIYLVVRIPNEKILSRNNIDDVYDFASKLKKDSRIEDISSIVTTDPRLTKDQYYMLYSRPALLNADLKKFLKFTTNRDLTVMTIVSKFPGDSPETKALVKKIRSLNPGKGIKLQVTGTTVNTIDVLKSISKMFPYAFLWIVVFSYISLLILLRSVVLPLKAILMTILSLYASYGVLVFIIQMGHFHQLLNFEPQHMLDISLLIIIFCALFGISMDYEVFLLARIKEYYEQTGDNVQSILHGIDHSSKIITSAAIIVILLCFSFMSADILLVKAFGLGIAVAAFVDAFLIRTIFVPATMAILGSWNWYLPKWLDKVLPKISFDPSHVKLESTDQKSATKPSK